MLQIIPAIDIRGGQVVRLQQGDYSRETVYPESPVEMARVWKVAGAPLIHLVDLDGARVGHPVNTPTVAAVCKAAGIPCELGGGIRTKADIATVLHLGVARAVVGTMVVESPDTVAALLEDFGADHLVASLDARDGKVAVRGWAEDTTVDVLELAKRLAAMGVRRVVYTNIRTDGMFTGPDLEGVAALCAAAPPLKVIASGGIGAADHVRQLVALQLPNLEGVIVGKALYDGRCSYDDLLVAAGACVKSRKHCP